MTQTVQDDWGLALGAWRPEVHAALLSLVNQHGINSPGYNPERPPLAALDCDETMLVHDLGEAMLRFVVTWRRIHADRGFWQQIPDRLGREAIQAAYNAVAGRSDAEVRDTAAFRRYRAGLIGVYEALRANEGTEAAYTFSARILRGLHEKTVAELVDEVLDHELDRPLGQEDIPDGPPFRGLVVPTGIRVYQEMLNLLDVLDRYGFETWLISASPGPIVRGLAARIDFPAERVLGVEAQTQSGIYTDRLTDPIPVGEGKLELFLDTVGRSPVLVMGDSMSDFDLMENCEGVSIAIDRGDEALLERAEELGWHIQSRLSIANA